MVSRFILQTSKSSWFLPFDKGYKDGAGNPPNPDGIMTDYLWKDILTKESVAIQLKDEDAEIAPVPTGKPGTIPEPDMDLLSKIVTEFNDLFGNIDWKQPDNVRRQIGEIPVMVSKDEKYQNAMKNSDEQSARLESERALQQVIISIMSENIELFKQFQDNLLFKKWLTDLVFNLTYNKEGKPFEMPKLHQENKAVVYEMAEPKILMAAEPKGEYRA